MNVARATDGKDGVVNSEKRENELSRLAREFIFDARSMEEIKEDLSYKNFLREVKKDEEKNRNFDSVVPVNSFMFSYRFTSHLLFFTTENYIENSVWIQKIDCVKNIPDFGFKIHIGFLPFAMKRVMESVDRSMKAWCLAHKIAKPMLFKIANLQKGFYSHMIPHINGSQAAKELVIYPFVDSLVESCLPNNFKNTKEKMGDLAKYYENMYTALSFAYFANQNFKKDIKNEKLTEQDFLPVKNDFIMEDLVHFRFGCLRASPILTKFLDSNLPKHVPEKLEDDRDFPMIQFLCEPDGSAALKRFFVLLDTLPYLEKISLYKSCLRKKITMCEQQNDTHEEGLLNRQDFFSGGPDEKASFKNFLFYLMELNRASH